MYDKICKYCGTKLSDYYRTGMLGCPYCYSAFNDEVLLYAKKIHGSTRHKGKRPVYDGIDKELIAEYESLLARKESAGIEGRFADMAALTAEIDALSRELNERGLI